MNDDKLFENIGFCWDRSAAPATVPIHPTRQVCARFKRLLPEFVWDAAVLEGNPFSFVEVQTLLEGITVGGHKLSDQEQVLNLAESSKLLEEMVKNGTFLVNKPTFCKLHGIIARNEELEWGHFRGEGEIKDYTPEVALGERGRYKPLPTMDGADNLNKVFEAATTLLESGVANPLERGLVFFLHGALQQYFFDGNKRTSRAMMNGILMANGIDAISIPAAKRQQFNEEMVEFYLTKEGTRMISFLNDLLPR
jgi:Fic family protein